VWKLEGNVIGGWLEMSVCEEFEGLGGGCTFDALGE